MIEVHFVDQSTTLNKLTGMADRCVFAQGEDVETADDFENERAAVGIAGGEVKRAVGGNDHA